MADRADLGIDGLSDFTVIGSGGFSTVYAAWDESFSRQVAVKLFHSLDETGRRRFDRERNIVGRLSDHPNVITPFRFGYTDERVAYLVMEYMDGGSLQDLVDREGPVDWLTAIDHLLPISDALGHGHAQGVLHRDVKPANVLLSDTGAPMLADYGIASLREATTTQMAYTLAHSPPETFASGFDIRDERSDLYSLASSLYTLIAGRFPYEVDGEDSALAFMRRIEQHPVPEIGTGPPELGRLLERTLAKDPADRPATAAELAEELRSVRAAAESGNLDGPGGSAPTIVRRPSDGSGSPTGTTRAGATALASGPPSAAGADRAGGAPVVDAKPPPRAASSRARLLVGVGAAALFAGLLGVVLWTATNRGDEGGDEALSATETTPLAVATTTAETTTTEAPQTTASEPAADAAVDPADAGPVRVGLLYDVEGSFPGGPNGPSAAGLAAAVEQFGIEVQEATPDATGSDREELLRQMAESSDLVFAGVESGDALITVAEEYPDVHFAVIDSDISFGRENVMALVFERPDVAYLVGAAAALTSRTGKIGLLAPVHDFGVDDFSRAPLEAGARAIDPDIEFEARFISETPSASAYQDAAGGARIAREMYEGGVDVIYDLTGWPTVLETAADFSDDRGTKVWVIGAWTDMYQWAGPGLEDHVLTSVVTHPDAAIPLVVRSEVGGTFAGGYVLFDLRVDAVSYSRAGGFVDDIADQLDDLEEQIVTNEVAVPKKFNEGGSPDG